MSLVSEILESAQKSGFTFSRLPRMSKLRRVARDRIDLKGGEGSVMSLQLVNDALIKLRHRESWASEDDFWASFFQAMRWVLIEHARSRKGAERKFIEAAGDLQSEFTNALAKAGKLNLDTLIEDATTDAHLAEAAMSALEALAVQYPKERYAEIIQMRIFADATQAETADRLGLNRETVAVRERAAYALLKKRLLETSPTAPPPASPPHDQSIRKTADPKPDRPVRKTADRTGKGVARGAKPSPRPSPGR